MLCWHKPRWEKVSGSCYETDPSLTDEGFQGNPLEQEQSINQPYLQQRVSSAAAADGLCGSSGAAVREAGTVWPLQLAGGNGRSFKGGCADLPVTPQGGFLYPRLPGTYSFTSSWISLSLCALFATGMGKSLDFPIYAKF